MKRLLVMGIGLLLATGSLFAQGFGGMMGGSTGNTIMVNTTKGLFALREGVLAKIDPATMQSGKIFQLFGPAPTAPADNTDRAAQQKYYAELQRRMAPAIMIAKDSSLIIVIGDGFARIDQETLKVEATGDLSSADKTADTTAGGGMRMMEPAPGYLLVGDKLCLMRSKEMLSVSITDGKILARAPLPKELQPIPFNFGGRGGFGGGNRGGGNRGGGAGGAGGANPAPGQ